MMALPLSEVQANLSKLVEEAVRTHQRIEVTRQGRRAAVSYRIELTASAKRALTEVLPEAVAVACWEFIRAPLAENPHHVGKPLRGRLEGRCSARRGEYRLLCRIFDDSVVVRAIHMAHRRDV